MNALCLCTKLYIKLFTDILIPYFLRHNVHIPKCLITKKTYDIISTSTLSGVIYLEYE